MSALIWKDSKMTRFAMAQARKNLTEIVSRVAYGGERIAIGRRNKDLAVLVSTDEAALLEEIEDRMDVAAARKALAEKGERIPLSTILRKYRVK
jgi:prevent-host-death family protein